MISRSKSSRPTGRRIRRIKRACLFCLEKKEPEYKDNEILRRFVSERGKIISRAKTGTCHKHQRRLMMAVKRARILALLPFA